MNFISKKWNRIGKDQENFRVIFRPLQMTLTVIDPQTEYQLKFKRGSKNQSYTNKYKAAVPKFGGHYQTIIFTGEEFSSVNTFFKEKDNSVQKKEAKIKIVKIVGASPPVKVCSVLINLSDFVGKGLTKQEL